ncbi:MAG: hypothetical protein J6X53_03795, partial [Abditibacteriota bacterium]|nr:hypothetical protein [Abditibacteriota bacterium]
MRKWLLGLACAAAVAVLAVCSPVALAEGEGTPPPAGGPLYPVSVEEHAGIGADNPRIAKVYQLALTDSSSQIPTDDFDRDGYRFHFLDMTKENVTGVDTKEITESVTKDCPSNDTAAALNVLDAEKTAATEDGYTGTLLLDHSSVKVAVKGYKTDSKNITATRTYPNLSDADLDLIPKTIRENGNTLTLIDAQWESSTDEDGSLRFTADAEYSGTATSRHATGYTVTANYTGHVVKTNCEMITYTVLFAGEKIPEKIPEETDPLTPEEDSQAGEMGGNAGKMSSSEVLEGGVEKSEN